MSEDTIHTGTLHGLEEEKVVGLRQQYGSNVLKKESSLLPTVIREAVKEPMFVLLALACSVYFILGQAAEGLIMALAIALVTAISVYQGARSSKALQALKELTEPRVKVLRSGAERVIPAAELVPADLVVLEEGEKVPADAVILQANDLSVNEAIITGESLPVEKSTVPGSETLYQGTVINSGKCFARVTATGNATAIGKIGRSIDEYKAPKTQLQVSISVFVRRLALFGILAFLAIWILNYVRSGDVLASLLIGLTLAMAAIPEEIPVAFSSFMVLGAYRLSKVGIISRQPQVIENLGAVSVICLDKTGTITENRMEVKSIFLCGSNRLLEAEALMNDDAAVLLRYAMLASEADPFDEMEKGIWRAYDNSLQGKKSERSSMIFEYPLSGTPPMMTHVYREEEGHLAAGKGAPERLFKACRLEESEELRLQQVVEEMAGKGQRVIAVASAVHSGPFPKEQDLFSWKLEGLVGLYDPPRSNIAAVFTQVKEARIGIKLITGDFPQTAMNIARQVGMEISQEALTGTEVMQLGKEELQQKVDGYQVFARMFPEAKLKVIEAIRANGDIVAMTGDGVNDGPALKAANVGIAMGKRGTGIARQAADLILTDDNLQNVVEAIRQGRKIFSNLKKAVRYIISIHIPIILTAALPVLLGWQLPNIFTPVHVIFLELIMGPTCSIFFENEPAEKDIMLLPPRGRNAGLFEKGELLLSIVQGLVITAGVLTLYDLYMQQGAGLEKTRTMVFTTLLFANIFLTFTNRSFTESLLHTARYRNSLVPVVLVASLVFLLLIHLLPPAKELFGLSTISSVEWLICFATGMVSVFWFEVYKSGLKDLKVAVDRRGA